MGLITDKVNPLPYLKQLQSHYPHIRFHLYSSATDAVDERLDRGLLDFAIIAQDVDPVAAPDRKPFSERALIKAQGRCLKDDHQQKGTGG